jgi:predicted ArsR family transcriptional regulator
MQPSTQEEILEFLNNNPGTTASELSVHLQVTQANIHYHIKNLLKQGSIETIPIREEKPGSGRPPLGYQLSRKNHFDFLAGLLNSILSLHPELLGDSTITELGSYFSSGFLQTDNPSLRVLADNVVQFLVSMNYHPHWEAGQGGPKIYFDNCPFAILLPKYPLFCQMDNIFLGKLFNMTIKTIQTKSPLNRKIQKCIFQISQE